ncbi:DDK kinase regulatory subunit DBF4 [Nakaseomyces bracarensis]|uniref:DDK kinase regulatory subunit DBF4 n=1 Tax=Nakaseomyces bracarensis TaxID=273131 RepID=A0ABR4P033_9SACH
MASNDPPMYLVRSPLKETDANSKQSGYPMANDEKELKKRILDNTNESLQLRKRAKLERGRSIEGAVQVNKNAALKNVDNPNKNDIGASATISNTNNNAKIAPNELLEWQLNWRKIMKRDSRIYFDTTDEPEITKYVKSKLEKRKLLLKCGFMSLGAQITQFFDTSVTIVISSRSVDNIHQLNESDILARAKKSYMKVWGYEKATRFLRNLDVDLENLEKNKLTALASPSLSNLLQNEKLYGPSDRDPRTRRDDIHYFKYPHIYMYDLWQTWAPIITLEWKPQELSNPNSLPYPSLKMGTFGRCPFIGDRSCDESSYKRVTKRYYRDKANKKYALKLKNLYQHHADPTLEKTTDLIFIPHLCLDSAQCFEKWQDQYKKEQARKKIAEIKEEDEMSQTTGENIGSDNGIRHDLNNNTMEKEEKVEVINEGNDKLPLNEEVGNEESWKGHIPSLRTDIKNKLVTPLLNRHETEEFPDDLCTVKKYAREPYEIKASGVHQSNDIATSFGNGLGPTKASVMSKNLKSLSRFVVDRKLGTRNLTSTSASVSVGSKAQSNSTDTNQQHKAGNPVEAVEEIENHHGLSLQLAPKSAEINTNLKKTASVQNISQAGNSHSITNNISVKRPVVKNSGYCENCRVKYECLEQHIVSEKHLSFANNDLNFEAIDSLIEKLGFQF